MLIIPKFEPHSPNFSLKFRHTWLVITAARVQQRLHLFKLASSLALPFLESHVYTHHILPDLALCVPGIPPPFSLYLRSLHLGAQQLGLDTTVTSSYTRSSQAQSQMSVEIKPRPSSPWLRNSPQNLPNNCGFLKQLLTLYNFYSEL